jgi:hypothetical protein
MKPGVDAGGTRRAEEDAALREEGGRRPEAAAVPLERFSFFVTSLRAMQELSGSEAGFGGDLRYGETGPGAGLRGADKICSEIAERSMPGSGAKGWRAFLSATAGEDGNPVHAIDRVGDGPWYDRVGRIVAQSRADLPFTRPRGAAPEIIDDLPNEDGIPNHAPDPTVGPVDNHDFLTGSDESGRLYSDTATCLDWTNSVGDSELSGRPRVGHSWPRNFGDFGGFENLFGDGGFPFGDFPFPGFGDGGSGFFDGLDLESFDGAHWISSLDEAGCAPGVNLIEMGPPNLNNPTVGSGGGYGGIYCFALSP